MKKAIVIAVSIASLASASFVLAREDDGSTNREKKSEIVEVYKTKISEWRTERQERLEGLKQERENLRAEFKEKMTQERCAKIEAKIQKSSSKFDGSKERHTKVYANLLARIDKFITKFTEFDAANAGKISSESMTNLTDDRTTLVGMIDAFKTAYADYISKLNGTKNLTCSSLEGELRSSLVDTRTYLKDVHDLAAQIRQFVKTDILPDLLDIKKQIAKARGGDGDNNEEESETEAEADETEVSDTIAPTVSITSPANGASYNTAQTVTISATAADNNKVKRVEFYEGTALKGTDTKSPFAYAWAITSAINGDHSWTAKAYDNAGNSTESGTVSFNVNIPTITAESE